ncbi:sugar phosphate isomerase/epimerase family protein [Dyadobacter bucti]|jgi:sugar phosphate isomerase/epimerase|uniref:sugar phosphate isomerase/epimerase family protein n=1 Tax=Dyadobacter bucti TaxID=2572203 RepID=UPI003F71E6C6
MINRRAFIKNTGAAALGALAMTSIAKAENFLTGETADPNKIKSVGLQLYSLKDVLENDLKGVLERVAKAGYKEVESYPGKKGHYYGLQPKEFSAMLNGMGLKLVSSHFGSGTREGKAESWQQATMLVKFDELVEKAGETGQEYLTCSWMDKSLRGSADDLKRTAELFNTVGEKCKKGGLQFAYHNHAFEFEKVGESMIYDFMLDNTDPKLVQWEMDIFWLVAGQHDPAAYFKKYPNRFPLGHVKDMDKLDKKKNTEIGNGSIDYTEILKAGKKAGMKHFIVEQESFTRPSIESMEINYKNLSVLNV